MTLKTPLTLKVAFNSEETRNLSITGGISDNDLMFYAIGVPMTFYEVDNISPYTFVQDKDTIISTQLSYLNSGGADNIVFLPYPELQKLIEKHR